MTALQSNMVASLSVQVSGSSSNLAYGQQLLTTQVRALAEESYVQVANGAVDQVVSLGGITTAIDVLVISDQPVSIKWNAQATAVIGTLFLLSGSAVTSIKVSNASGIQANLQVVLAG